MLLKTTAKSTSVALLLLSFLATNALAQDDLFNVRLDNVTSMTLANGLEVIVVEDHSMPIVTVEIAVHNGALTEPPEYNGLSHLYEHMFFKGNAAIPTQEQYLARQRELGMAWNGTTGTERVNYYFTLPSHLLCEGMQFMSDGIRTPLFDAGELVREREVVLGEYDRNEANPYYYLYDAVDAALWYAYPSRKDSLGDRATIQTATVDQMQWLQDTFYVPNNSALFLAGDVTPTQGFALAEEVFGAWERAPDPFVEYPLVEHPGLVEPSAVIVEQDVQVMTLVIAWHGPDTSRDPAATFAADTFSFIIGQNASRFQQNLVESGITLGADLSYYTQANVGPINLGAQLLPNQLDAALVAISEEIDHLTDADYFTEDQLQTAKTLIAVSELYSREQTSSWVHTLSFWWAVAGLDYYDAYVQQLAAVTREDINRYIQTYIQDQPMVVVVMVNGETREALGLNEQDILDTFLGVEEEPESVPTTVPTAPTTSPTPPTTVPTAPAVPPSRPNRPVLPGN